MTVMVPQRHRAAAKKPMWIIMLLSMVCFILIGAYVYPPHHYSQCYLLGSSSSICTPFKDWLPTMGWRERSDEEVISSVVIRDILAMPMPVSKNPKIALMFLTPGSLPFEKLWEKFLEGQEGRYSIYVHASREKPVHTSSLFVGRDIHSGAVVWGLISMVDAEKRLLANALEDVDNQFFVLLSDSCIPLHSFDYVYNYLMGTNVSFVDCFKDPGPHGSGRYSVEMFPEIEQRDFRKGAQWFAVTRRHALLILADNLYYKKFKLYCKPESINHLLVPCVFARQFWAGLLQPVGMVTLVPQPTEASFEGWWCASSLQVQEEQERKGFNSLVVLGAWIIWKHRNRCVFDGLAPCVSAALLAAREEALLWTVAGARGLSLLQATAALG